MESTIILHLLMFDLQLTYLMQLKLNLSIDLELCCANIYNENEKVLEDHMHSITLNI